VLLELLDEVELGVDEVVELVLEEVVGELVVDEVLELVGVQSRWAS
jgi:hypothetical protein